jgi:hypothetical protein
MEPAAIIIKTKAASNPIVIEHLCRVILILIFPLLREIAEPGTVAAVGALIEQLRYRQNRGELHPFACAHGARKT